MTREERALQVWQVLIGAAHRRQTITYEQLGEQVGLLARGVGRYLFILQAYCGDHDLPPITALVVGKESGRPGEGSGLEDVPAAQARVYEVDWYGLRPLAAADLQPYAKRD